MTNIKLYLHEILEKHESPLGRFFGHFLAFVILLSTFVFLFETTDFGTDYPAFFRWFDFGIMVFFGIEYLLRLSVAHNKWSYVRSPLALIDLLVFVAFLASFANISVLRSFRVLKIFQLLRILRYSEVMLSFFASFKHYRDEIKIFFTTFFLVLLISASGIYFFESDVQPDKFGSIPDAMWWAVVTISTLGYGDVYPFTVGGKIISGIVAWLGLATIAIMTALITKIFIDHFFGKREHKCFFCHYPHHDHDARFCKNCGEKLDMKNLHRSKARIVEANN